MTVDDLHELYEQAEQTLGPRATAALMSRLPVVPAADIATKTDLFNTIGDLRSENKTDVAQLRGEFADLRGEFAELRGEFAELRGEFAEMRNDVAGEVGDLRREIANLPDRVRAQIAELEARIDNRFVTQQRWLVASMLAVASLALAIAPLV